MEARSPNHWTAREYLVFKLLKLTDYILLLCYILLWDMVHLDIRKEGNYVSVFNFQSYADSMFRF